MNTPLKLTLLAGLTLSVSTVWWLQFDAPMEFVGERGKSIEQRLAGKAARAEYYLHRFHDPRTKSIPEGIRQMELTHSSLQVQQRRVAAKSTGGAWREVGPNNIGGRVRALAVDAGDSDVLIAGGVTGGIWRSTNRGQTWQPAIMADQTASITAIAQDPRAGSDNVWYAAGGERSGSSGDRSFNSILNGSGIYKSVDGGQSWSILPNTANDQANQVSPFGRIYRLVVQPTTGHVFFASAGFGVYRSTDGGENFSMTLPITGATLPPGAVYPGSSWSDIVVHPNGRLFVALTESTFAEGNVPVHRTGLLFADGEGAPGDWQSVPFTAENPTIGDFRVVVAIAPSNPDLAYVMDYSGNIPDFITDPAFDPTRTRPGDQVRVLRVDLSSRTLEDRSDSLPAFFDIEDEDDALFFDLFVQGGYNMTLSVKPDDEDFVLIGGTNLYRTFDGFNSPIDSDDWIGGYDAIFGLAPSGNDNHPDVHSIVWDPANPDGYYMTGDGGVYYAADTDASTFSAYWDDRNRDLNVLQSYHMAFGDFFGQDLILTGTQDNGTPGMVFGPNQANTVASIDDFSGGDGAFSQVANGLFIASSQNGNSLLQRPDYANLTQSETLVLLVPDEAAEPAFIAVNAIDPGDGQIFYYAATREFWRNAGLDQEIATRNNWEHLTQLDVEDRAITAIEVSTVPEHVLYYGASAFQEVPQLFRVADSSSANPSREPLNLGNVPVGAYIHDIAVNPLDANELLVVVSNYLVDSLYYSTDGGQNFEVVDGTLSDETDAFGNIIASGPSVRSATILPRQNTTHYLIATSTGVYATESISGSDTAWQRESTDLIGSSEMAWIESRPSDGRVVAASHGRGVFALDLGEADGINTDDFLDEPVLGLSFDPARDGHGFELSKAGDTYIMLFYSYDAEGNPEWYIGTGDYVDEVFVSDQTSATPFSRFTYDPSQSPPQRAEPGSNGSVRLSYRDADVAAVCNDGVERNGRLAAFQWSLDNETDTWCVSPLLDQRQDNPEYTGTWFAGAEDTGWGLSLQNEGSTLVSVLYYYDNDGIGRWAIGSGALSTASILGSRNLTADFDMIQVRGYCRTCPLDRENLQAGSIGFDLSVPSRSTSNGFNRGVVDVTYQGQPGGVWQRDGRIAILSTPR